MANYLIVQRGPEIGRRYDLGDNITTLGRSQDNDIELDDPYISRYHAVIKKQGSNLAVIDLGSENPVLIRDTPLDPGEPYVLQHRDIIRIGQNIFSFINGSAIPARPAAPALDAYKAVPQMSVSQPPSYSSSAANPQASYQPVGSSQDVQSAKPVVEDEGATMVGTNFGSILSKPGKSVEAAASEPAPSNPAVSSSSGSFNGNENSSNTASTAASTNYSPTASSQPAQSYNSGIDYNAQTNQPTSYSQPASTPSYNQYSQSTPSQYSGTAGTPGSYQTAAPDEDQASTTVVNTSDLNAAANQPPAADYAQNQTPYNQYGRYDSYNQQSGQGQQWQQYGQYGQSQAQSSPYGQYDQGQAQPGQSQSQSGYGQGQQSQSQSGYGQPQSQYGQYNPYNQPVATPVEPAKKDDKAADSANPINPKEEYSPEDAPTTVIRIDKSKM